MPERANTSAMSANQERYLARLVNSPPPSTRKISLCMEYCSEIEDAKSLVVKYFEPTTNQSASEIRKELEDHVRNNNIRGLASVISLEYPVEVGQRTFTLQTKWTI